MTYRARIREAIAIAGYPQRADDTTAALIEDLMRVDRVALDGLTASAFHHEVAVLVTGLNALDVELICESENRPTPAWAKADLTRLNALQDQQ